jgi:hypothetical protein
MQSLIYKNFQINKSQDISYEIFKDEIIIINLKSGKYFQIENSGVEIFKNIKNNLTTEENIRSFIPLNNKNKLEIIKFIQVLKKNHVILETTTIKEKKVILKKYKYKKPKISIYNDMKKILISDPIHDIPEKHSWPKKKK